MGPGRHHGKSRSTPGENDRAGPTLGKNRGAAEPAPGKNGKGPTSVGPQESTEMRLQPLR
jgi:hypothetical protein